MALCSSRLPCRFRAAWRRLGVPATILILRRRRDAAWVRRMADAPIKNNRHRRRRLFRAINAFVHRDFSDRRGLGAGSTTANGTTRQQTIIQLRLMACRRFAESIARASTRRPRTPRIGAAGHFGGCAPSKFGHPDDFAASKLLCEGSGRDIVRPY
jgi:hypothetical protein